MRIDELESRETTTPFALLRACLTTDGDRAIDGSILPNQT